MYAPAPLTLDLAQNLTLEQLEIQQALEEALLSEHLGSISLSQLLTRLSRIESACEYLQARALRDTLN
jgi:hypothetical protein